MQTNLTENVLDLIRAAAQAQKASFEADEAYLTARAASEADVEKLDAESELAGKRFALAWDLREAALACAREQGFKPGDDEIAEAEAWEPDAMREAA